MSTWLRAALAVALCGLAIAVLSLTARAREAPVVRTMLSYQVDISTDPPQPTAGQPATVRVRVTTIRDPNEASPNSILRVFPIDATSRATGEVVRVDAAMNVDANTIDTAVYDAPIVFPSSGIWDISTQAFGNATGNTQVVSVVDGAVSNPGGSPGAAPPSAGPPAGGPPPAGGAELPPGLPSLPPLPPGIQVGAPPTGDPASQALPPLPALPTDPTNQSAPAPSEEPPATGN